MDNLTHYEKVSGLLTQRDRDDAARVYAQGIDQASQWVLDSLFTVKTKLARGISHQLMQSSYRILSLGHAVSVEIAKRHNHLIYADGMDDRIKLTGTWAATKNEMLIGVQMLYHTAAHEVEGRRVFQVSEGLAHKLIDTDLRGLTADDLHLPYGAIFIEVPMDLGLRIWNTDTGWHRVTGIYLSEDPLGDADTEAGEPARRTWRFLIVGETLPVPMIPGTSAADNDALMFWKIVLKEGKALDDILREASADFQKHMIEMVNEWPKIWRFCMNVVLYATCGTAEIQDIIQDPKAREIWRQAEKAPEGSHRRRNLLDRYHHLRPRERRVLGRSIVLDRSQPRSEGDGTSTGRTLAVRQRVERHWKRQFYGPGRTERRLILIEPYFRGPEDGPGGALVHKLK